MHPWLLPLFLLLSSSCVAPLVQDAGLAGPDVLEPGTAAQLVEVRAGDGVTLRGAFLDAGPGAPVVLHLLPSGASTRTGVPAGIGRIGLSGTLETLRAHGWSSLVLDYRGVGRSDGERDAGQLSVDGRAMWDEALRRAGGAPSRVVVRATSIGTLVAAGLLATGSAPSGRHTSDAPGAAVLVTPVRAPSVVMNAARERGGTLAAWWARMVHTTPAMPDLTTVVASGRIPLLLVLAADDPYLPAREAEQLHATATGAGHRVEVLKGSHARTVLRAWGFDLDEEGFAGRRVTGLMDAERQFLDNLELTPTQ